MCGIVGYIGQFASQQEQENTLQAMTDRLAHRGPDGVATWCQPHVGLGHARLAIIDLNTGDQPMWDAARQHVIVFNGEIYNYPELYEELVKRGYKFLTTSDTEVIPAVIQEWGIEEGLMRLRGMFAFALFNVETQTLLLARDRVGIKPLYYARKSGTTFFASEPKSLLLEGLAERNIDPVSIHDYFALGFTVTPKTCWDSIRFLPPGSWLEIGPDGERSGKYWEWTPRPDYSLSESEWLSRFEATLNDAVRTHLLSDVPLGAFLSGGIDSSLVVALLSRNHVSGLDTFNVSFEETSFDEAPFANLVAEQYRTNHHQLQMAASMADPDLFVRSVGQFDEPFADVSSLPTYLLSQATSQHIKVVLSGDGGDELMGGYPHYIRLRWIEQLSRLQWMEPAVRPFFNAGRSLPSRLPHRLEKAWDTAQGPLIERLVKLQTYFSEEERASGYTAAFRDLALAEGHTAFRLERFIPNGTSDPLDQLLTLEMRLRLQAGYLRKVDISSAAHGLEVRVPFLDNELLEFSEELPVALKVHGKDLKYLSQQLARKYLPHETIDRPKHGFNLPFDTWANVGSMRNLLSELILAPQARWQEIFSEDFIRLPWAAFTKQVSTSALSRFMAYQRVFMLASLELWLQSWKPNIP